jgi:hypothetical protein
MTEIISRLFRRNVAKTHTHAAKTDRQYFQIALSKFAFLHCFSFVWGRFSHLQAKVERRGTGIPAPPDVRRQY